MICVLQVMVTTTSSVYFGSYKFMSSMAKATYDPSTSALRDGGIDLNMESGMAEYVASKVL